MAAVAPRRGVGRPPSPRRSAGGRVIVVRVSSDEFDAIEASARACGMGRAEFVRHAALTTPAAWTAAEPEW